MSKTTSPVPHLILSNGTIACMTPGKAANQLIANGTVALAADKILWVGSSIDTPQNYAAVPRINLEGRLVTPALIDCHTHLIYGGDRAGEFEMRLNGATYTSIARAGGGILSTVRDTRANSSEELTVGALSRVDNLIRDGVTTIEIKSGYGLDIDTELKMLRVARTLPDLRQIRVKTTFLGAHALPAEFSGRPDAYVDFVCNEVMPRVRHENLADAVDAFCEAIAFSPAQVACIFKQAKKLGFALKLHAEQLSNMGGAALAASYKALSADHLEYLDERGVHAMAKAKTIAVLLPGAFYMLGEKRCPPVQELRRAGVPMAVATDCNPGTSPLMSLLIAMNMSCMLFGLTPWEALLGVTRNAALALGQQGNIGILAVGKTADLAVWDVETPAQLVCCIGANPLHKRFFGGVASDSIQTNNV